MPAASPVCVLTFTLALGILLGYVLPNLAATSLALVLMVIAFASASRSFIRAVRMYRSWRT